MRYKSVLIVGALIAGVSVGALTVWLATTPNHLKLLGSLTLSQQNCIKQIIKDGRLAFLQPQESADTLALGYMVDKDYYASIVSLSPSGNCHIEFNTKAFDCYDEYQAEYCQEFHYSVEPKHIKKLNLTDSPAPIVYVWFDVRGLGVRSGAHHSFYGVQPDGSAKLLLALKMCLGLSSLRIDNATSTISALDDVVCDMFHGRKEHIDYFLPGETPKKINDWFDP